MVDDATHLHQPTVTNTNAEVLTGIPALVLVGLILAAVLTQGSIFGWCKSGSGQVELGGGGWPRLHGPDLGHTASLALACYTAAKVCWIWNRPTGLAISVLDCTLTEVENTDRQKRFLLYSGDLTKFCFVESCVILGVIHFLTILSQRKVFDQLNKNAKS